MVRSVLSRLGGRGVEGASWESLEGRIEEDQVEEHVVVVCGVR